MAKKRAKKSQKSKSKPAAGRPPREASWLPQETSKLMQLPQELRDKIYSEFFSSICLGVEDRRWCTPSHALALLRTCRRIHSEIGSFWLRRVLFSFGNPESMLEKLTKIPPETFGLIRHVRVEGDFLRLSYSAELASYETHAVLQLLPGLKLDTLTVTATRPPEVAYRTLTKLIDLSSGWKELHFISDDSLFLGFAHELHWFGLDDARFRRRPQPSYWQKQLEARDGKLSSPRVAIYRAKERTFSDGAALDPDQMVPFEQKLAKGQSLEDFGKTLDESLCAPTEMMKSILVTVKRGKGVDYEQRYDCQGTDYDIRADSGMNNWQDIKAFLFRLGYDSGELSDSYDDYEVDFDHDIDQYLDDEYGMDSDDQYDEL